MNEEHNSEQKIRLLLSPREAAQALAVSERTLWHMAKDGQLEFDSNQPTHHQRVLIAIGHGGGHE